MLAVAEKKGLVGNARNLAELAESTEPTEGLLRGVDILTDAVPGECSAVTIGRGGDTVDGEISRRG